MITQKKSSPSKTKMSICSNNCQRQSFHLQFGSMCSKSSSMPETYSDFTIRLNKNHLFLMGWVTYSIADSNNSAHFVRLPPHYHQWTCSGAGGRKPDQARQALAFQIYINREKSIQRRLPKTRCRLAPSHKTKVFSCFGTLKTLPQGNSLLVKW